MSLTPTELLMIEQGFKSLSDGQDRLFAGQERLADGQAQIIDRQDHLDDCVDGLKVEVKTIIEQMKSIVPDGNFRGHHDYHLQQMNRWQFWHKIKSSVLVKVFEYGAVGAAGWLAITLWGGFKIVVNQ